MSTQPEQDDGVDFMDLLGPEIARLRDPTAPPRFGTTAIVTAEFSLPPEQALPHSVANPTDKASLTPYTVRRITANNIRYNFMQLLANNEQNIQAWLEQVAAASPKIAIELLLEIAQFVTPKLKAVAIATRDDTDPAKMAAAQAFRSMSTEQLLAELAKSETQ